MNSTSYDNDSGILQSSQQQPMEATPNPKPRKQGRLHSRQPSLESPTGTSFGHLRSSPFSNEDTYKQHHTPARSKTKTVLFISPHANNPDADFINVPALVLPSRRKTGARASRRSATPIIPYEPPTDVFTPPREVFLSPVAKSMGKSSKRKTIASASAFKSAKSKKKGSSLTIVTAVKQELPDIDLTLPMPPPSPTDDPLLLLGSPEFDFFPEPMPPRRREISIQVQAVDRKLPPSSPEPATAMDEEAAVRWDGNNNNAANISMDENFDPDDAGMSPVKLFDMAPNSNGGWSDSEDEHAGDMEGVDEGEGEYTEEDEEGLELNEEEEAEEQEVRRMSVEPEQLDEEEAEEQEVRRMSVEPEQLLEEEEEVSQISVELDDDEELASPFGNLDRLPLQYTETPAYGNQAASCIPCHSEQEEDDDQISDDSDELSHGIVKITSADPRSAARAAAILKQVNIYSLRFECYWLMCIE